MNNDDRVLKLKQDIAIKKEKIKDVGRFAPITNCLIEVDGINSNIHALDINDLTALLVKLNAYYKSSCELGLQYNISGFPIESWISDLTQKVDIYNARQEELELRSMEIMLDKLLET